MLDLQQPPYRHSLELLAALRASDTARDQVACDEVRTPARGTYDQNEMERARLAHVLLLEGRPEDVALVRFLLEHEVTARRHDSFQGAGDALTILSTLLLAWGDGEPEDTWLFWTAKRANFDTFAGGYDIAFVFAQHPPDEVVEIVRALGDASEVEILERFDAAAIVRSLPTWRAALASRFPRRPEKMHPAELESWAELFGDREGMERYGLLNATSPDARARLYRRLERYAAAVEEWRVAAALAGSPWDQASRLRDAITDAAKVPLATTADVEALDALRPAIPSWNDVGLGRMSTLACYELAAALDGDEGARIWNVAERWRRELDSFTLVGLRAAVVAAERWGTPAEVEQLRAAADEEHRRIHGE
jgi:hypothetical protein